ncbi:MAG: amino acid permease [Bacteroidetes bacterium]|nr:amino acid permease [Bacteroidota bacterium]
MPGSLVNKNATFGTLPVFMTAISTILGAILFLRFGWAVGNVGILGVIGIIILGHLITIPTALAVAEIATNQKVQGGGAYYIISRSFGLTTGGAIGIALFLSQAISVSFYVIAFAEAFEPLIFFIRDNYGLELLDKRLISVPTMLLLSVLIIFRGANLGMKALYVVVIVLFTSLLIFFLGSPTDAAPAKVAIEMKHPERFFGIFTIVFPAFTGLAAGLGLSGDLRDPKKSIPRGTIWATAAGLIIYILVAFKLNSSASATELANDQMIMQKIALWGPIIPLGLAAASLSSALGSIMVAPRTLQAIGYDEILPNSFINKWFSKGKQRDNEPVNASIITVIIAIFFVAIAPGEIRDTNTQVFNPLAQESSGINFIANIISMFFMVTYGAICSISFLEHFAADPAYRPTFKSKWYFSLLGAVLAIWAMFMMNAPYAAASMLLMAVIYYFLSYHNREKKGLEKLFRGVIFQLSRQLQIFVQRADKEDIEKNWRPFAICISEDTFKRRSAFDLMRWISFKYGFGTYIHYIPGLLNDQTNQESKDVLDRLLHLAKGSRNRVYLDTIISPSYTSAIAQVIQLSGISGKGNNMILFEFSRTDPSNVGEALKNYHLLETTNFDVCVLNTSYKGFGYRREIHVWITSKDYENANLMILLAYIILGHPEWRKGVIKIFAIYPHEQLDAQQQSLLSLIKAGRLPISPGNIELIPTDGTVKPKQIICEHSVDADLVIVGFRSINVKNQGLSVFEGYDAVGNVLFVNSYKEKEIK